MNKHFYIFTESHSKAGSYGVGSYIRNLIGTLSLAGTHKITIVSVITNVSIVKVIEENNIRRIKIPKLTPDTSSRKHYFQSVYYILHPFIDQKEKNYFHFNFFSSSKLARKIRETIENSKLFITVHYFNEYEFHETGGYTDIKNNVYDRIIVLNNYTKTVFKEKYFVDRDILIKIPNGVPDDSG